MTEWDPQRRDVELRSISGLTKGLAIGSVGATLVLAYGIAWGDQQRVGQAAQREAQQEQPGTSGVNPPGSAPTPAPAKSKAPKSKSGGS